jgi:hypothetical protein
MLETRNKRRSAIHVAGFTMTRTKLRVEEELRGLQPEERVAASGERQ